MQEGTNSEMKKNIVRGVVQCVPPVSGLSPVPAHLNMPALLPWDLSLFTFLKIIDNCRAAAALSDCVVMTITY